MTTNYLKHIDDAIEKRFGDMYEVVLPDADVRKMLIQLKILDIFDVCGADDDAINRIVDETVDFTGRDFDRVASRLEDVEYGILKSKTGATLTIKSVVAEISKQRGIMIRSAAARAGSKSENK
ncbi:MAG: hypothetical protein ACT6FG_05660 [Methanosarcinaceae archaeon]